MGKIKMEKPKKDKTKMEKPKKDKTKMEKPKKDKTKIEKTRLAILISLIAAILLYILFGVGIWQVIFAMIIGLLLGAWSLIGKGQTLKYVVIFYGIIWVVLKIIKYFVGKSSVLSFLSIAVLFAIIGAVIFHYTLQRFVKH